MRLILAGLLVCSIAAAEPIRSDVPLMLHLQTGTAQLDNGTSAILPSGYYATDAGYAKLAAVLVAKDADNKILAEAAQGPSFNTVVLGGAVVVSVASGLALGYLLFHPR